MAMDLDWGSALRIGGMGFGTILVVLAILSVAVALMGRIMQKTRSNRGRDKENGTEEVVEKQIEKDVPRV
jgi:Na+-transporting methylmalonyl-CoA/oxaloacetate decarboxylase gamma subunit